ncbi:RNA polymerase sigma factor [Streptomyces koyangensis]|uniref:RNA polymerase sigma factor n=1 Tax=Streptomyces TaxID=1883 RepID=UPI003CFEBD52
MTHRTDQASSSIAAAQATVTTLAAEHDQLVHRVARRALRQHDQHLADDIAQDVWLTVWRLVLDGGEINRPTGLLATITRRRVIDHYRLARVRREVSMDPQEYALDRLTALIGAAA